MSRRDNKGKQVKTFTHFVPQLDLSLVKETVKVYFKADEGRFYIYPPDYILETIKGEFQPRDVTIYDDRMCYTVMDTLIEIFQAACASYLHVRRTAVSKKVIVFTLRFNHPNQYTNMSESISFVGSPAVFLNFNIYFEANGKLYRMDSHSRMAHSGSVSRDRHDTSTQQIDWTQGREDFFNAMKGALTGLIDKLVAFTVALKEDPDLAISTFSHNVPLIAGPKDTD